MTPPRGATTLRGIPLAVLFAASVVATGCSGDPARRDEGGAPTASPRRYVLDGTSAGSADA